MHRILAHCSLELMVSEGEGNGESLCWSRPAFLSECAAIECKSSKNTNGIRQMSQCGHPPSLCGKDSSPDVSSQRYWLAGMASFTTATACSQAM